MKKAFGSSFLALSTIAILVGVTGSWLSGMWDLTPPEAGSTRFVKQCGWLKTAPKKTLEKIAVLEI